MRDERALAAEGFGGLLAVGAGSARPPRLVELAYRPGRPRGCPHVVLVGKGITFDSGGLSLKPREAMVPMKTDMAGGGAVIAVMAALRDAGRAGPGHRPGAGGREHARRRRPCGPQDVITHYGGRTVEVLNTDAEGRLVLADALAYADAQLDPDLLVDLATLTGAASLGAGPPARGPLQHRRASWPRACCAAGESSGERLWRMPLVEDYRAALDSDVADLRNTSGDPHVSGGSITAALFLREFTGGRPLGPPRHRRAGPRRPGRARGDPGRHRLRRPAAAALAGGLVGRPDRPRRS